VKSCKLEPKSEDSRDELHDARRSIQLLKNRSHTEVETKSEERSSRHDEIYGPPSPQLRKHLYQISRRKPHSDHDRMKGDPDKRRGVNDELAGLCLSHWLPPPVIQHFRGKLVSTVIKQEAENPSPLEVHRSITGHWIAGLDLLLTLPGNSYPFALFSTTKGGAVSDIEAASGCYSGWFALNKENAKLEEEKVVVRFLKTGEGYCIIRGEGRNIFGKYQITGSVTADHEISLYRHYPMC